MQPTISKDDFLRRLAAVWAKFPMLRFGQLIENAGGYLYDGHRGPDRPDLFYVQDADLIAQIEDWAAWAEKNARQVPPLPPLLQIDEDE